MIFDDLVFFLFFLAPCVTLFHRVRDAFRPWVITAFGVGFFLYFSALYFGGAWGALTVVILLWECATSRLYRKGSRWCFFGIAQAIAILCAFKYLVFFGRVWNDAASIVSLPPLHGLPRLVLPLGLSFFTFEFISYAADCYVGKIAGSRLRDYAAFIFFFPTMVSGPIKRFPQFRAELEHARFDPAAVSQGITRIAVGLAKKHALADTFDLWASRLNTDALYSASRLTIAWQLVAYGWKIYFDFSSYSDIAIGSGKLFGIVVPENFDFPYLARNIAEFWRRWHISLLAWLQSYVFIPLLFAGWRFPGLNGVANLRRMAVCILAVFFASGLWHGADYHFVVWGLYHGVLVAGFLFVDKLMKDRAWKLPAPVGVALTYGAVNAGYAFFAMDMPHAWFALERIAGLV